MSNISANNNQIELTEINGEFRVDSRIIASRLNVEHESLIKLIVTYEAKISGFGLFRFEIGIIEGKGRPQRYAFLNENQCYFLATLSRNSDSVVEFKEWIVKSFSALRVIAQKPTTAVVPFAIPTNMKEALLLAYNQACEIEAQSVTIAALKPKADYTDEVLSSESTFPTKTIAKELGMSSQKLYRELCVLGIIYEHGDTYVLYAKYDGKDYAKTKTYVTPGGTHTKIYLVWTEKGRNYIHQVVANRNKVAANNQTEIPLRMAQ